MPKFPTTAEEAITKCRWRPMGDTRREFRKLTRGEGTRLREAERAGYYTGSARAEDLGETAWWDICEARGMPTLVLRLGKSRSKFVMDAITVCRTRPQAFEQQFERTIEPMLERAFRLGGIERPRGYFGFYTCVAVSLAPEQAHRIAAALVPIAAAVVEIFKSSPDKGPTHSSS